MDQVGTEVLAGGKPSTVQIVFIIFTVSKCQYENDLQWYGSPSVTSPANVLSFLYSACI